MRSYVGQADNNENKSTMICFYLIDSRVKMSCGSTEQYHSLFKKMYQKSAQ